jgi:transposase InsO family protein
LQSHSPRRRNHRAVTPRRFRACTTDSHHDSPVAPNRPNQIWLADVTYVPTGEGWLYLAAVLDLFTRKIVGWLPTLDCVKKRKADGKGKMEIIRCLKRFVAREIVG